MKKRIVISVLSIMAIVALAFGVLPAVAKESSDSTRAGYDSSIGPYTCPGTCAENDYSTSDATVSEGSIIDCVYPPLTTQTGKLLEFTISATDPDNDTLLYSASNLPPGATFDPQTRIFSWTPAYDQAGTYPGIRFQVSDGQLTDFEDITITVLEGVADLVAPKISGATASSITTNSAVISWLTDEPGTSKVDYGVSLYNLTVTSESLVVNHSVKLSSLSPGTTYCYKVTSVDGTKNLAEYNGGTFTTLKAAAFSLSSLNINPSKTTVGKKVTIRVTAANRGTTAGSYVVTFKINGVIENVKTVTIAAGSSLTVGYSTVKYVAGTYNIDVNGLGGSFVVSKSTRY